LVRGFRHGEAQGRTLGKSSIAFSYRIVGRRKDIKERRRFAEIDTRLRMPVPPARRSKMPRPTPAGLRAVAARIEKAAQARMGKRARRRKGSAG
jgi:hypothetical protein